MPIEIANTDALAWLAAQQAETFSLFILDPPYNVGYRYGSYEDNKPTAQYQLEQLLVLSHCQRLLKPGGSIFYLNYPETSAEIWARVDFLQKVDWLPWIYHSHLSGKPLRKASRAWCWFAKGNPVFDQNAFLGEYRNPEDKRIKEKLAQGLKPVGYDWLVMEQVKNQSPEKRAHPCQVPEKMLDRFILGTTKPGDLVGDCYLGSGTTALACQRLGRSFAGCELDPAYIQVARQALGVAQDAPNLAQVSALLKLAQGQAQEKFHSDLEIAQVI
jgi:site-specific DNA-methyltransferase (adenine-specific)